MNLFRKNVFENYSEDKKGFTLIELLVVISIIGVLSIIAMTSLNGARQKAMNTKKIADFNNINQALQVFYSMYNRMPQNYNPCCGACESTTTTYYDQSMQELVDAGLFA
ncbi:MAG: type II secretion system protein [Candidatus Paceibacterota bacterium]